VFRTIVKRASCSLILLTVSIPFTTNAFGSTVDLTIANIPRMTDKLVVLFSLDDSVPSVRTNLDVRPQQTSVVVSLALPDPQPPANNKVIAHVRIMAMQTVGGLLALAVGGGIRLDGSMRNVVLDLAKSAVLGSFVVSSSGAAQHVSAKFLHGSDFFLPGDPIALWVSSAPGITPGTPYLAPIKLSGDVATAEFDLPSNTVRPDTTTVQIGFHALRYKIDHIIPLLLWPETRPLPVLRVKTLLTAPGASSAPGSQQQNNEYQVVQGANGKLTMVPVK
jgi:hypothetical protein